MNRAALTWAGLALWAAQGLLVPAWARGNDCAFRTGGPLVVGFGVLDPSAARPVRQPVRAPRPEDLQVGDCAPGIPMRIWIEGGQHDAGGQLRMKHSTRQDAFLPYSVQVTSAARRGPGIGQYLDLELTGSLAPADIANAHGGTYSDTLRISVTP